MSLVVAQRLTYTYPGGQCPALDGAGFSIEAGDIVVAAGPSGSGKSTLLRSLTGLVPQFYGGTYSGAVAVAGLDPASTPVRRMAAVAGLLFQEPEAQAVADTVEEDVAFALEQRNMPQREMRRHVSRCLDLAGAGPLRRRRLSTLSGGERQRVAIASTLALAPRILLLDEPSSQLDASGEANLVEALLGLRLGTGIAILVAEHRLQRWLPRAGRVLKVAAGSVTEIGTNEAASLPGAPPICLAARNLGLEPIPLNPEAAVTTLAALGCRPRVTPRSSPPPPGDELLAARGLTVRFSDKIALDQVSTSLREGELVALVGPNGSGKTTLLRAIAGTLQPAAGTVHFQGRAAPPKVQVRTAFAGLCPQDPGLILRRETVREEIRATLRSRRSNTAEGEALGRWNLSQFADRDPRDLSSGERARTAMAAMLAHEPPVWLLDEPSRGAGTAAKEWLAARLRAHADGGGAALIATHDIETAARFATRVVGLERGRVAFDLPVREALGSNGPCPTQVARAVPGALIPDEVSW